MRLDWDDVNGAFTHRGHELGRANHFRHHPLSLKHSSDTAKHFVHGLVLLAWCLGITVLSAACNAQSALSSETEKPAGPSRDSTVQSASHFPTTRSPTDEDLVEAFMQAIGEGTRTPQVVTRWVEPIYIDAVIRNDGRPPVSYSGKPDSYVDDTPAQLEKIVRERTSYFKDKIGIDIREPPPAISSNLEFSLYGWKGNPSRWVSNLPRWYRDLARTADDLPPPYVLLNFVYGGVVAVRVAESKIDRGGCSATFPINAYRVDLAARRLRASQLTRDEVDRRMQNYSKPGKNEIRALIDSDKKRFPDESECVRNDYMLRWRKIVDSCFAASLGLHPAPAFEPMRDFVLQGVANVRYERSGYETYERYWPLFLQILYSDALPVGTKFADAKKIALREIAARRSEFDVSEKPSVSCTGVQ